MTAHAEGTFTVKSWDENTYEELEGNAKLTKARMVFSYAGDLEAEGTSDTLMCYLDDGTAVYTGLDLMTGQLGGRSGSGRPVGVGDAHAGRPGRRAAGVRGAGRRPGAGARGAVAVGAAGLRAAGRPGTRGYDARPGRGALDLPALRHRRLPWRGGRLPGRQHGPRTLPVLTWPAALPPRRRHSPWPAGQAAERLPTRQCGGRPGSGQGGGSGLAGRRA